MVISNICTLLTYQPIPSDTLIPTYMQLDYLYLHYSILMSNDLMFYYL